MELIHTQHYFCVVFCEIGMFVSVYINSRRKKEGGRAVLAPGGRADLLWAHSGFCLLFRNLLLKLLNFPPTDHLSCKGNSHHKCRACLQSAARTQPHHAYHV